MTKDELENYVALWNQRKGNCSIIEFGMTEARFTHFVNYANSVGINTQEALKISELLRSIYIYIADTKIELALENKPRSTSWNCSIL